MTGTSIAQIVINWYMLYFTTVRIYELMALPFDFADFSSLSAMAKQANYLASFNIFVANLKILKYLSFNKTMNQLSGTLSQCSKELGGFTVMFAIFRFAIFTAILTLLTFMCGCLINLAMALYGCGFTPDSAGGFR